MEEPSGGVGELVADVSGVGVDGFRVSQALGEFDVGEECGGSRAAWDGVLSLLDWPVEVLSLCAGFLAGPFDFSVGGGGARDHCESLGWLDALGGLVAVGFVVDLDAAGDSGVAACVEDGGDPVAGSVGFESVAGGAS